MSKQHRPDPARKAPQEKTAAAQPGKDLRPKEATRPERPDRAAQERLEQGTHKR